MNTATNYAATFHSETDNNAAVLEKNVIDYPSSSVARFLLLYHYKKNNDPRFEELAKQTAIYFYNPLWAQYQLSQAVEAGNIFIDNQAWPKPKVDSESKKNENILTEKHEDTNEINNGNKELPLPVNKQINTNLNLDSTSEEGTDQLSGEAPSEPNNRDVNIATVQDNKLNHQPLIKTKEDGQEESIPPVELPVPVNEPELPVNRQINKNFILTTAPAEERTKQVSADQQIETIPSKEGAFLLNTTSEETVQHPLHQNNADNGTNLKSNAENIVVATINEETGESTPINLQTQNAEITENGDEEEDVPFEPLYTVDYFASQGIKIPEEVLVNDNLGKQVKSFTAWLKSMKKLHPGQLPEQNQVIERIIQASSEVSNQNAHVLTEAMAEVLVKQGKQEKAIEMYQKLSLLNPSKSAYFAAKIENLNII